MTVCESILNGVGNSCQANNSLTRKFCVGIGIRFVQDSVFGEYFLVCVGARNWL